MKILPRISQSIADAVPDALYCWMINQKNRFRGYNSNLSLQGSGGYLLENGDEKILLARRSRNFFYKRGIANRLAVLASQYQIDKVNFTAGDIIVDCGANIGEIGMWANSRGLQYHAFEPEELEAMCCDENAFGGETKTQRLALWHEDTELEFYSKPDSADGSLIEIKEFDSVKKVQAVTFSNYFKKHIKSKIRLFKVEAEGAEPEVLSGAKEVLGKIDYISVDCGFERGVKQESTFNEVCEILVQNKFDVVSGNLKRGAFLFKNRSCIE